MGSEYHIATCYTHPYEHDLLFVPPTIHTVVNIILCDLLGYLVVQEYSRVVANNIYATKIRLKIPSVRFLHDCFLNFLLCNHPNKAGLIRDCLENTQHISIALDETKLGVNEPLLLGVLFH